MSVFDSMEKDLNKVEAHAKSIIPIGFVTRDGKKHLGFYKPLVNPCGDNQSAEKCQKRYIDIYGNEYFDVTVECSICEVECFYWDELKNEYTPLPSITSPTPMGYEEKAMESMKGLFRQDLITSNPLPQVASMIRDWLFLNAHCEAPIYIDKSGRIHSDGVIIINQDAAQSVPDYLEIVK